VRKTATCLLRLSPFRRAFPGQWTAVSLPVSEQRVLDGIENALEGGEPRLGSMFAIFTRLTRDDEVPRTEALLAQARLSRIRPAMIVLPLILGLVAFFIFMAVNSSGAPGCRSGRVLTRTTTCQSAPGTARSSAPRGE
jgi:hypothetical protein